MTKQDLFWRLFQASGHVGAYLLYSWSRADGAGSQAEGAIEGDGPTAAVACRKLSGGGVVASANGRKGLTASGRAGG